tara:strand:+ start:10094 stop:10705 length:612 start_codon:yes stop_codon:yes gene_type:complete
MKKVIMIAATIMVGLVSNAQKQNVVQTFDMSTPFEDVKRNYKLKFFVMESLIMKDGSKIQIGDTLMLGESASKLTNTYETILFGTIGSITASSVIGTPVTKASTSCKGNVYVATKMRCTRSFGQVGVYIELTNVESTLKIRSWKTITASQLSLLNGELINPNAIMTSDEALAELKKAKDKFDLGLLTQEEFNKLRSELAPLIK